MLGILCPGAARVAAAEPILVPISQRESASSYISWINAAGQVFMYRTRILITMSSVSLGIAWYSSGSLRCWSSALELDSDLGQIYYYYPSPPP